MASNNLGQKAKEKDIGSKISIRGALSYKAWALLSVLSQVVSVVILKYAAINCGSYYCSSLACFYVAVASLIFARVIFWNKALAKGDLSEVYVFTALTPVLLLWLSGAVLNEEISHVSVLGTCIVVFAIYMQQRTGRAVS